MTIRLSIGIPAYLNHFGVQRILDRLEDRADLEILISEDLPLGKNGINILPAWKNIRYMKNSPPLGAVRNWNAILNWATGDFVWVLHHDEAPYFQDGLDAFFKRLSATKADLLLSRLMMPADYFLKRAFRFDPTRRTLLRLPKAILLQNYIGSPSNMIVRRDQLELFDENLQWFVDMEWFYRQINKAAKIDLSAFEIKSFPNSQSITASLESKITEISQSEIEYICAKHNLSEPLRHVWRMKVGLRDLFYRRRGNA